tara:strand:- start:1582 stop:1821 length:240 start_codon:yes stop_codon:yes gene_type:complete
LKPVFPVNLPLYIHENGSEIYFFRFAGNLSMLAQHAEADLSSTTSGNIAANRRYSPASASTLNSFPSSTPRLFAITVLM